MLAPISSGRRDRASSFRTLIRYLTKERDPVTGERLLRGDALLSSNLLSLETADAEMQAAAAQNRRADDPIMHYQLAWHPGELPTFVQWQAAALRTLQALGFKEHQYVCVAHDDKAHFHVHVMVNRIHPETYRALNPFHSKLTLDKTIRELEHEFGWKESPGLFRWDKDSQSAVRNTRDDIRKISAEFKGLPSDAQAPDASHGRAAKLEHFNDRESLAAYSKTEPAKALKELLTRDPVSWEDVHSTLYSFGLQLEKAERGGYTVRAAGSEIRVKASEVFRFAFAGKDNRSATEAKLGEWEPLSSDKPRIVPRERYTAAPRRDPEQRAERRDARAVDRAALKADFVKYKKEASAGFSASIAAGRDRQAKLFRATKEEKRQVRTLKAPYLVKQAMLSHLAAEYVAQRHALTVQLMAERRGVAPLSFRDWVTRVANEGDKRAAAQMRGWRYQDVRNLNRIAHDMGLEDFVGTLEPSNPDLKPYWSDLENERLKELRDHTELAHLLRSVTWKVDQSTGHVRYSINHQTALIDRGTAISLAKAEELPTVLGLEMAVSKFGKSINATGSIEWQRHVADVAAKYNVNVVFTDAHMQAYKIERSSHWHNPYHRFASRIGDLQTRINHSNAPLVLTAQEATDLTRATLGAGADHVLALLTQRTPPGQTAATTLLRDVTLSVTPGTNAQMHSYLLNLDASRPDLLKHLNSELQTAIDRSTKSARSYQRPAKDSTASPEPTRTPADRTDKDNEPTR